MKSIQQSRITYAISKAEEEVIILGSSRANHHYVPAVLEDSLKMSVYNAGCDGQFVFYDYCVLKNILYRNKTQVVILDILPWEFQKGRGYQKLSVLLPYYYVDTTIQKIVNLRSKFEKFKTLSNLYRYNSMISTIVVNNVFPKKKSSQKGYLPLTHKWKSPIAMADSAAVSSLQLDTIKINVFKKILSIAKKRGVKVYVFVSPWFVKCRRTPASVAMGKKICADFNVPFFDFSKNDYFLKHPELFHNPNHLNNNGAEVYTSLISSIIKSSYN
jgi:hypothetical protein